MSHHSGGTIPALSLLQSSLGIPTTVFGWGLGDKIHAPNERVLVSMLEKGRRAWVMLLLRLAGEDAVISELQYTHNEVKDEL
jgi:acetylornithine deacetylase/succinyl-diaminopimelate desuccinylase-like protein